MINKSFILRTFLSLIYTERQQLTNMNLTHITLFKYFYILNFIEVHDINSILLQISKISY